VYLPAGAGWRDAWTGTPHPGGRWVTAAAPLEVIPVYVRDGGTLEPFGPPSWAR
jgi:alpha-D-xyloside xylohydrolase